MITADGANLAFLIGAPRSGTTLLTSILGKTRLVHCPPEPWIGLPIARLLESMPVLRHAASDVSLSAQAVRETLGEDAVRRLAADALVGAYNILLARRPGATKLIDKTPRYYKIAPLLAELLREARFILVSRDPLDVAASHKDRWGIDLLSLASPEGLCDTTFDVLVAPLRIAGLRERLRTRAHWIRYEDLVMRPEEHIRALCDFLDVPFSPELLDHRRDNPARADLERSSFGDREVWRRETIDASTVERWRSTLSVSEVALVCGALGPDCFDQLGYHDPRPDLDDVVLRQQLDAALAASLAGPERMGDDAEIPMLRSNLVRVEQARVRAESARARWETLCREAEADRDAAHDARQREAEARAAWERLCREAETDRDAAHDARQREAEARAAWERLCHEAETDRDAAHDARQREAEARATWERLCHEAEAGRTAECEARQREAEARADWERLCHEAEAQRDELATWRERLRSLWPWMDAVASADPPARPRISIVTPSFNQGQWIEATIESVLAQKYPDFEHIVVDGGSSDETAAIVARYPHVRFVSEPDRGQAHAINKGMLLATGNIVAYLNSDDLYRDGAFEAVAEILGDPEGPAVLVGDCDYIDEQGESIGHLRARLDRPRDLLRYWGWDRWFCVPQQAVFWRRTLLAEVGLFDASLQYTMDYEMWLRMSARVPFHVLHRTLAAFRMQSASKTVSSTWRMYLEERASSRRHWPSWWRPTRWYLEVASTRHVGHKLLAVAEHEALANRRRRHPLRLLGMALLRWPLLLLDPRAPLTAVSAATAGGRLQRLSEWIHRSYLHALWRVRQRTRRDG